MKIRAIMLGVMCWCVIAVQPASAAFFDGSNKWYMAPGQWELDTSDDVFNTISVVDSNDQLQFTANNPSTTEGYDRWYESKWTLDLKKDFDISVEYKLSGMNVLDPSKRSAAELELGIASLDDAYDYWLAPWQRVDPAADDMIVPFGADSTVASTVYARVLEEGGLNLSKSVERVAEQGRLYFHYDSAGDTLLFGADQYTDSGTISTDFNGLSVFGLRTEKGIQELYVYLDGYAKNSSYDGKGNYLENFIMSNGDPVVTPEPASMVLFGIGGAAMAFSRRRIKA